MRKTVVDNRPVMNCVLIEGDVLRCFEEGQMEVDDNDCRGGDGGRK